MDAQKRLEMIYVDCIKIIRPDLIHLQIYSLNELSEQENLILDRMVIDHIDTVIDLLKHDLGHIKDATIYGILEEYENMEKIIRK